MRIITRKLEFDAGHRLVGHETKCANLHGHRYVVEVSVGAEQLDAVGRVIDFGEVKRLIGGWIDETWDHGMILNVKDEAVIGLCVSMGSKVAVMQTEPTAENMVVVIADKARELLEPRGIKVVAVRLYETPNCWADWSAS